MKKNVISLCECLFLYGAENVCTCMEGYVVSPALGLVGLPVIYACLLMGHLTSPVLAHVLTILATETPCETIESFGTGIVPADEADGTGCSLGIALTPISNPTCLVKCDESKGFTATDQNQKRRTDDVDLSATGTIADAALGTYVCLKGGDTATTDLVCSCKRGWDSRWVEGWIEE